MSISDDDTVDNIPVHVPDDPIDAQWFEFPGIELAALTNRGRVRSNNEDQYAVVRRTRTGSVLSSSLSDADLGMDEEQHAWLLSVADGLGGQVSGDIASATAIRTILKFSSNLSSWIMRPIDGLREDLAERVDLYAQAIQKELAEQAEADPTLAGMATTMTAAYLFGANGIIVNVGDSRSYLVRANSIHQITRDHTFAEDLKKKGAPPETLRPYKNLLTRCFSTFGDPVNVDMFHVELQPDDQLLLCSDGLSDMVDDQDILMLMSPDASTKDTCERLVTEALANGGRDNITVITARIK